VTPRLDVGRGSLCAIGIGQGRGFLAALWLGLLSCGCAICGGVDLSAYRLQDVGSVSPASFTNLVAGGADLSASGADIGGTADQCGFLYAMREGDFDLSVRVAGVAPSDVWAKAGIMVRETLDPGGRFVAALATPGMAGCFFEERDPASGKAAALGSLQANHPNTWLRLQRVGGTINAYGGFDGQLWTLLGSVTTTLSNQVFLGFAAASHTNGVLTTARFRDANEGPQGSVGTPTPRREQLGPSSRKTPIAISEIMYKPAQRADGKNLEFVEIYNSNPFFHDIGGYRIVGDNMNYAFAPGTRISGGGFIVIAASPDAVKSVYGITNVLGPYVGSLKKSGQIQLLDEVGSVLLTVPYSNEPPWPVGADGTGHSLVLANPSYGEGDSRAWDISDTVGGSPGDMDGAWTGGLRDVVINEVLARAGGAGAAQFIELYNCGTRTNDLSGCVLTDDPAKDRFVFPLGTTVLPGGFVSVGQDQLGFALSGTGGTLYLIESDHRRVLDAVQYELQSEGVSYGRWPNGARGLYPLGAPTPGAGNGRPLIGDVVINELMYDPISGDDADQYVELYNQGGQRVSLADWRFVAGITYVFPGTASIGPGEYLVIAANRTNLLAKYPNLTSANTLGNYGGKLSHGGERVALAKPEAVGLAPPNGTATQTVYVVEDEVTYGTGGRWGQWAAGGGSSLELIDARANHRLASNWGDSDDSGKSQWTTIEETGVLDNGGNYTSGILYAQLGLLDVGECLIDDVEVVNATTATNLVLNPDFESGLGNWTLQGCHFRSSVENEGYASAHSLHVRCSDRIWTGDNSCQVRLGPSSLGSGQTATLRFKARWLHGWPEALMRLNGNWLEATGRLPVPMNLGTPGAPNSRTIANAGPAIYDVTHSPSLPAVNQTVTVTARIDDPDGVAGVVLNIRADNTTNYTSVAMTDDGQGADLVAGDGVFSASVGVQSGSSVAAFYITAIDSRSASTRFPALRNDNAPVPEGVIMFGDHTPLSSFGIYHLWITRTNSQRWASLGDLSNEAHDCTFVNGSRVIYNAQARFAGSPYHQDFNTPTGSQCHYKWIFPEDDKFLGATSFNKIHQPGNGAGDDTSVQREQTANMLLRALGVPWLNRRFVGVYVNGGRRGTLMEDAQTPDGDVVKEHFPKDSNGFLYKMQPWFEFAPTSSGPSLGFNNNAWCYLMPFTTTGGVKKKARYRYNFEVRRTPDSASNFTNVFSLIDAAGSYGSPDYVSNMEGLADMENWMRVFAANHAAGNWDAFGCQNAQNLYGYIGTQGTKYSLLMWDFNIVFGNSGSWGPGQELFTVNGSDPNTANIYNEPTFRRMYWRALQELVNGALNVTNSGPLIDAKYAAILANGITVQNPAGIKSFLTSARTSIASQLAAANTTNFTVGPSVVVSNNVAYLSGVAPVGVKTVTVNGTEWPLRWTSVSNWSLAVPVRPGTNSLALAGVDIHGQPVSGASGNVVAVNRAGVVSPIGNVVINEIMYDPILPGGEYVELYNSAPDVAFDLSGWEVRGLGYVFPPGSLLAPRAYLVLAADRLTFAASYGATVPVFDTFDGSVPVGPTLMLLTSTGGVESIVSQVRYERQAPWPIQPPGSGRSLQLIDPSQDTSRVANWSTVDDSGSATQRWQRVSLTGIATKSTLLIGLVTAGDFYIDDIQLVAGGTAEAGQNYVTDGDFESVLSGHWTVSANVAQSAITSAVKHSGQASLHVVGTSGGATIGQAIWQDTITLITNSTYTLSYWYLPGGSGSSSLIRLSGSAPNKGQVYVLHGITAASVQAGTASPGQPNTVADVLPAFPALWINEVEAENISGITNRAGERAPWIEIYNAGTNAVSLSGLFLADSYTNLAAWAFPSGASIGAGGFQIVFADGKTNLSTPAELHANFSLPAGSGSVALTRMVDGFPQVLDYVNYSGLRADHSYGAFPDGQGIRRQEFSHVTPMGTNDPLVEPLTVSINEWMADNAHTLPNAADANQYDDWFELFNYGTNSVDLTGCFLSDDPADRFKSQIGPGYSIPARGFMLVWADKIDAAGTAEIHAGFRLSKSGSSLFLTAADGRLVDSVTFGAQAPDISQGRSPDGSASIYTLPSATPGGPNSTPNTAPALEPIPDQAIRMGQVLTIQARAVDAEAPPQVLTYSIAPGAPAGLAIDAASGAITWTPSSSQAESTNLVTVIVTDNGVPGLSDSRQFRVTVLAGLDFSGAVLSGSNLELSWETRIGDVYQVQYKESLSDPAWTPLGGDRAGNGGPLTVTIDVSAAPQRYYRLVLVP